MDSFVLGLHNITRWVVVLTGLVALLRSYRGLLGNRQWTVREGVSLKAYAHTLTFQLVLGLLLYFFLSPLGLPALTGGGAMSSPGARYYALEHPVSMLLALALAHVAVVRARKAATDGARFRTAAILLTLSFVLVLARTPWDRSFFPSF